MREKRKSVIELLEEKILVCDGAMGTMLFERGLEIGMCCEGANIHNPDIVLDIHKAYVKSGADIIETNTFGANRVKLSMYGLEDHVKDINIAAVDLARQAAGKDVYVAGAVGPTGKILEPYGVFSKAECYEAFLEQISYLFSAGVDLLIIETMSDLEEALLALKAAKEIDKNIPVISQMAFSQDGKTFMGVDAQTAAYALSEAGADVVGANCGGGIVPLIEVVREMKSVRDLKVSVQPNAGLPKIVDGRTVYTSSPEYFRKSVPLFIEAGANILGGCCGTTPIHISAICEGLMDSHTTQTQKEQIEVIEYELRTSADSIFKEESQFSNKLKEKFVITVEIDPPKGTDLGKVFSGVKALKSVGVDGINISDSPMARVRLSPVAIAHILKEQLEVESILHFTCRDRNLLGIQSELLGASALGINNVLALTGDPPTIGDHPNAKPVFDVNSEGLVHILAKMNSGFDLAGNALNQKTNFCIGVAANPGAENLEKELSRLRGKVKAGAHFIQTQPIYDIKVLEQFMESIKGMDIPVLVGILPLRSSKHAEFLHNEVPGISIPLKVREKMQRVDPDKAANLGVDIAFEFMKEAEGLVEGAYLMPPFGRYEMAIQLIERFYS